MIEFPEAYASASDAVFLIFQLPAEMDVVGEADGPGIGYVLDPKAPSVFLSAEGTEWVKLKTGFRLLVEPIIVPRTDNMLALQKSMGGPGETQPPELQTKTGLGKPYPNPFNPMSTLSYSLAKAGQVKLQVFDVRGRVVKILAIGHREAGEYVVEWMGEDERGGHVASGVYFVRLEAGQQQFSERLVLLK